MRERDAGDGGFFLPCGWGTRAGRRARTAARLVCMSVQHLRELSPSWEKLRVLKREVNAQKQVFDTHKKQQQQQERNKNGETFISA